MENLERRVRREVRAMTRQEIITKAIAREITWLQAAQILRVSARQMRRIKRKVEQFGMSVVLDQRGKRPRRRLIKAATIEMLIRLKRDVYPDFSLRHFYEQVSEKHQVKVSYNWLRLMLQAAGVVEREPGRGRYRRRRERRPLVGMLVHLDASTHEWIAGVPKQDLVVALDDADGRILYAHFFAQEGTASTFAALDGVLRRYGRFCELYTDRATHYRPPGPSEAEAGGQVSQALRALGIRLIQARSPQARGRSERAFGTIQGRLPQELRLHQISDYERANRYLEEVFVSDFNRRFTVRPTEKESAFVKLAGIELERADQNHHDDPEGQHRYFSRPPASCRAIASNSSRMAAIDTPAVRISAISPRRRCRSAPRSLALALGIARSTTIAPRPRRRSSHPSSQSRW